MSAGASSLREAAIGSRDCDAELVPLGSLLGELTDARSSVAECFLSGSTYFLVLRPVDAGRVSRCCQRDIEILRRILLGERQKLIALDLDISDTSVATTAARVVRALGFDCPARKVPIILMMAARAELEPGGVRVPCSRLEWVDGVYRVVRVQRPSPAVLEGLSECEQSIVDLLMDRRSNAEIARARNRSGRTVANQLANILRKLGVSSRSGVLSTLAAHWCRAARLATESVAERSQFRSLPFQS